MTNSKFIPFLWMGVAFGIALALAVVTLTAAGTEAKGIRVALRLTARWSFVLFWVAYTGRALTVLFGPALTVLAQRGREFGLAFAAAHVVHIGLVVWLSWVLARPPLSGALLVFFLVGIFWTYLLMALSFGGLSKVLGPWRWRLVRILGLNYILMAFSYDFVLSVVHSATMHQGFWRLAEYVPFAAMSIAAPLFCLAAGALRRTELRHVST